MTPRPSARSGYVRRVAWALFGLLSMALGALYFWWAVEIVLALRDPSLGGPAPAQQSWRWHRALTPAFAEWEEGRKGTLRPGMLADLVVWSADLLTIPAEEILRARPDLTVVGGRIVYRR